MLQTHYNLSGLFIPSTRNLMQLIFLKRLCALYAEIPPIVGMTKHIFSTLSFRGMLTFRGVLNPRKVEEHSTIFVIPRYEESPCFFNWAAPTGLWPPILFFLQTFSPDGAVHWFIKTVETRCFASFAGKVYKKRDDCV